MSQYGLEYYNKNYITVILIIAIVVSVFFFSGIEYQAMLPQYPIFLILSLACYLASGWWWEQNKRKAKALILDTELSKGGHTVIHLEDIRLAYSRNEKGEKEGNFACLAGGGFVYGGVEWHGAEVFVVCPPEHIMNTQSGIFIATTLHRVSFKKLPDWIQQELSQLAFFNEKMVATKKNLLFGMTSKYDGSSTMENFKIESKFLDQTGQLTLYKSLLDDAQQYQKPEEPKRRLFDREPKEREQ